jgi:colanic acid/amylovoran biosynthesis protein
MLWHSANSGNLGVGALTVANLAVAREVAAEFGLEPRFTIIGMRDAEVRYLAPDEADDFGVDTRALLSPSGCWSVIGAQDCLLDIGGGDSFADIYGARRFAFLWLTKLFAFAQKRPLLMSPQTIGPFTKFPYRGLARYVLERSAAVVARDEISLNFLREVAPRANGVLSADVAFALPYEDRSAVRGAGGKIRVGVNVSGLLLHEAQSGSNRFGLEADYAALNRRFIADLVARPDVEVHVLTHVVASTSGRDDDGWAADEFAGEFPTVVRAPDFKSPSEAKSYISGLDFLVAGRMHACIGAFSSGVPVVPIAYSRKFAGLFGMLDYPWGVPTKGMSTDEAVAYLHDCLARRDQLAADEARGMGKVKVLLEAYRQELRRLFQPVAEAR